MVEILASDHGGDGSAIKEVTEVEIEFLQDWKCCWHKDDRRAVAPHFAKVLIELGIARAVDPDIIIGDVEAKMQKAVALVSDCCNAPTHIAGEGEDTRYFVCAKCGKTCEAATKAVHMPERHKMMTAPVAAK